MTELKLEFMFHGENCFPRVSAQVALDPYQVSRKTGMPAATRECDVMHEFERELQDLEIQIANIRKDAKQKFIDAGVRV
jgi:hypothetical protein